MTTFGPLFVPAPVRDAVSDEAWLDAMLDVERALANALSLAGEIPAQGAAAVAEQCDPSLYDLETLCEEGRHSGNPAEPLVRALRERVAAEDSAYVHVGGTSRDVLDSAMMVVARNALALIDEELAALEEHLGARGAQALEVREARERLRGLRLPCQLGGHGTDVRAYFAAELDLEEPGAPWYGDRPAVAEIGAALDRVAVLSETIARGPRPQAPSAALACACARGVYAQTSLLESNGVWQVEWGALSSALALAAGAVAGARGALGSRVAAAEAG